MLQTLKLNKKIGKQRKIKFGRIDSWINFKRKRDKIILKTKRRKEREDKKVNIKRQA